MENKQTTAYEESINYRHIINTKITHQLVFIGDDYDMFIELYTNISNGANYWGDNRYKHHCAKQLTTWLLDNAGDHSTIELLGVFYHIKYEYYSEGAQTRAREILNQFTDNEVK